MKTLQVVEEEKEKQDESAVESSTLLNETGLTNNVTVDVDSNEKPVPASPGKKRSRHMSKKQMEIIASINQFQTKLKKSTVHVWWLFDDGGEAE